MAITFPTTLDTLTNPTGGPSGSFQNDSGVTHSEQHANANDAIEALEAKVGVDGSAVPTSLDFLVKKSIPGRSYAVASGNLLF